jgi:hypothetical protein
MEKIDTKKKITTDASTFLEKRLNYYLMRTGAESLENLTFKQRKKIFLLVIKDFMDEIFSVDALSAFSFHLHDYKADYNSLSDEEKELFSATQSGLELSFYVRKFPEQFSQFMTEVKNYFEKHFPF